MYAGSQCPKCFYHSHEHFYVEKKDKKWSIERCANCHYGFDIEEFKGSSIFFYNRLKYQRLNGIE